MATIFVSAPASQLCAARHLADAGWRTLSRYRNLPHNACEPRVFVDNDVPDDEATHQIALGMSYQSALFQAVVKASRICFVSSANVHFCARGLAKSSLYGIVMPGGGAMVASQGRQRLHVGNWRS